RAKPGDLGWQSSFRATERLCQAFAGATYDYALREPIQLRGDDGKLMDYRETAATHRMRREINRINQELGQMAVDHFARGAFRAGPHLVIDGAYVLPAQPQLYRVFNRGRFTRGGRVYGWFQNLPKEVRRALKLNQEPVSEPDFRQMHA